MIRAPLKLLASFLFCFILFSTTSYMIYHTDTQMTDAASSAGVTAETTDIFQNIVIWFRAFFGILIIGHALIFLIGLLIGRDDDYNQFGGMGGNQYVNY